MPRNAVAAHRYARSFLQVLAERPNEFDAAVKELEVFLGVLQKDQQIASFFESPIISLSDKLEVIDVLKTSFSEAHRLLHLLVEAQRLDLLTDILSELKAAQAKRQGERVVTIEVARTLSTKGLKEITEFLEAAWKSKVRLQVVQKPELMGGFVARSAGKMIDASVASQLRSLESQILEAV